MKQKVIVILGQTSTGKSDFAVNIARNVFKNKAEIISADSRQVYKGLDLGTGKITKKEMQGIPHHLLDVISPKKTFTVTEFKNLADKKIEEIISRGNVPILCGGTGFYIDAVVNNMVFPEVPPNPELRKKLAKQTPMKLFSMLEKLDSTRAKDIKEKNEINNKVRLIRAIEIAKYLGKVPKNNNKKSNYDFIKMGLYLDDINLKDKIKNRLFDRIKKGMLNEAENLHKKGLSWKRMKELGLEYRYMALFLERKINKTEMLEQLTNEINHYAKRQKTWFKRDEEIKWFNPGEIKKIEKFILSFF
ncbi:MAG: tRNA (adenosine(37)-N6)-dimethylallyltransferase MiaA [bacterium]|nr:tRNA (adenosine(37)-N6)-dimethylallyltransferase MiaA [bacterium]